MCGQYIELNYAILNNVADNNVHTIVAINLIVTLS